MNLDDLTIEELENMLRGRRYSLNKYKANADWSKHRVAKVKQEYNQIEHKLNELKGDNINDI